MFVPSTHHPPAGLTTLALRYFISTELASWMSLATCCRERWSWAWCPQCRGTWRQGWPPRYSSCTSRPRGIDLQRMIGFRPQSRLYLKYPGPFWSNPDTTFCNLSKRIQIQKQIFLLKIKRLNNYTVKSGNFVILVAFNNFLVNILFR